MVETLKKDGEIGHEMVTRSTISYRLQHPGAQQGIGHAAELIANECLDLLLGKAAQQPAATDFL